MSEEKARLDNELGEEREQPGQAVDQLLLPEDGRPDRRVGGGSALHRGLESRRDLLLRHDARDVVLCDLIHAGLDDEPAHLGEASGSRRRGTDF